MLLGISGEIGCGKSTVADALTKNHGYVEYSFATPLKNMAICAGFEHHQVFGTQEQKLEINQFWGVSGREFLQRFGSEVCRDFVPQVLPNMRFNGKTMWVRLFEKFKADNCSKNVVVSDVRFEDESQTIHENGGVIIRIVRGDLATQAVHASVSLHKSETQASKIKLNNGSLEALYEKMTILLIKLGSGEITSETYGIVL
jgi:hypothetical protein